MHFKRLLLLFSGPFLFLLFLMTGLAENLDMLKAKVLGLTAWMISWWITEVVALPVTAILPIVILPLLQVFTLKDVAAPYSDPIIFLFMGGFILALAVEKQGLHKRVALNIVTITGIRPDGVILGFMVATAAISMWISNTATAVMMLPIAASMLKIFEKELNPENSESFRNFGMLLMLGIAYAANIGGTATIIGTPPNVVLMGLLRQYLSIEVSFLQWMAFGVPFAFILLITTWITMTKVFPHRYKTAGSGKNLVEDQVRALGPMKPGEKRAALIFFFTAFFWIFRSPLNSLFSAEILNDTIIAMAGGLFMFVVPESGSGKGFLLEWKDMKELPWGILLLFGGGLALARALEKAGIIQSVGDILEKAGPVSPFIMVLVLSCITLFLTELMSNVALTTIFIPVVFALASGFSIDPVFLAVPVTLASSCAFMMPVSTPPNAIVFASGYIKGRKMMRIGFLINLVSVFLLALTAYVVKMLIR